jgi:hypothetical protein
VPAKASDVPEYDQKIRGLQELYILLDGPNGLWAELVTKAVQRSAAVRQILAVWNLSRRSDVQTPLQHLQLAIETLRQEIADDGDTEIGFVASSLLLVVSITLGQSISVFKAHLKGLGGLIGPSQAIPGSGNVVAHVLDGERSTWIKSSALAAKFHHWILPFYTCFPAIDFLGPFAPEDDFLWPRLLYQLSLQLMEAKAHADTSAAREIFRKFCIYMSQKPAPTLIGEVFSEAVYVCLCTMLSDHVPEAKSQVLAIAQLVCGPLTWPSLYLVSAPYESSSLDGSG